MKMKMITNEEIIENARRLSQDTLSKGKKIIPKCLIYTKSNSIEIMGLEFRGYKGKEEARKFLRKYIAEKDVDRYVIIFDTKMTIFDTKMTIMENKTQPEVIDAVMISIYTAKDKITKCFPYYKDKKLRDDDKYSITLNGRVNKEYDCWDIWGKEMPSDTEFNKKYQEFKDAHNELYRGLDADDDEYADLKNKGKLEKLELKFGVHIDIYRLGNKALIEGINSKGEVFFSGKGENNEDFNKRIEFFKDIINKFGDNLNGI
jgi:hypothetical protein